MKPQNPILLSFKNLLHPVGIIGPIIAIIIPIVIFFLGLPDGGHKDFIQFLNLKIPLPQFLTQSHKDIIQLLDVKVPLPLFLVQFAACIALFAFLFKDFRNWIRSILPEKKYSILALLFAIAVTIFAGTQIEARHRVQSDESIFLSVAQNMYYNHESSTCNQGYFEDGHLKCVATSNSFKTKGLAFLYYLGMHFFGTELHWIFNAELLMLPLAFLLMFLAIVAWTRQPLLAFLAALLMALQPTVLFQFRAMSVEPLYIFLSALSLFVFKWAYDRNTLMHWILLALILAFFAQTRQETVFCLFAFVFFAFPKILDKKDFKASSFFVTLALFSVPALLTISYYQGFGFQGGEFDAHGHFFEDLKINWIQMTLPLKENGELVNPFLSYFNYLFAIGAIYLLFRAIYDTVKGDKFYLWMLVFLLLYHVQTFMILENVSGDFSIQINQRYSLVMIPSMAFIGALPIAHAIGYFAESISVRSPETIAFEGLLSVAIILSAWTAQYKNDFNKNIMYRNNHLTTEEHEILGWLKNQPEKERLFIYARPWHFVGYGVSSVYYDNVMGMDDKQIQQLLERYPGEVYYIRGMDCWDSHTYHAKAVEHRKASTCDMFERKMDLTDITKIDVIRSYKIEIAKFNGRKTYNPANIIVAKAPVLETPDQQVATDSTQPAGESLGLHFELNESAQESAHWTSTVTLNGKILEQVPYTKGARDIHVPLDSLQQGYNHIRFLVLNQKKREKLADISMFHFNPAGGTTMLPKDAITKHRQDWGNLYWGKSIEKREMTINDIKYANGFGTHANSETTIALDGKYRAFRTSFGLDDESLCSEGVSVQIIGDGKILAKSPVFQNSVVHTLSANTEGIKNVILKTTAKGSIDCSHVDFVNPVLIP